MVRLYSSFHTFLFTYKPHQLLKRLTDLCEHREPDGRIKNQKHEQRLLKNLGAEQAVLDLLAVPHDPKDSNMKEVMTHAHKFLQAFVYKNQTNQNMLHAHVERFLVPGLWLPYSYHVVTMWLP